MLLDYFARPRRQPMRWTAGLAVTALVGTFLVTDGAPAAATATEIDLPSTVLATPDELPDGTITRVKVTDSLIALQVASNRFGGSRSEVWTRERSGADPAWRQVADMVELRGAEGGLVHGYLARSGNVVMRVSDGSYRAVPDRYQVDRGGEHVSFFDRARASVTIQDAVSGSGVATVPLGTMSSPFAGHQVAGSLIAALDGHRLRHLDVPTGQLRDGDTTLCGGPYYRPEGELVAFDGRFALVRCGQEKYSVHDRDVYRPALIDYGTGGDLSDRWSLNNGVLIGISKDIYRRPAAMNPWTGVIGYVSDSPTSAETFDTHGDLGVFASGDTLYAVDLSPITSSVPAVPPDSAAPSVTVGGNAWSPTRDYTLTFKASDADAVPDDQYRASGVARTEARYRTRLRGEEKYGPWSAPIVVGTSHSATAPAGSSTCWQARGVDNAGNIGAWTERCVQIDGKAPSVTSRSLPPAIKATGTTTDVTFRWSGNDDGGIDRYTIRHRATPRGQRTAEWTYVNLGTKTSFTKGRARSRTVCFQVKARDLAGNESAWSTLRCTYVDGIKPKITEATVDRWLPTWPRSRTGLVQWSPTFRYTGADDDGAYRYQQQTKGSDYTGGMSTSAPSSWLTSTSLKLKLDPVDQECARVRVKDRAGNVSDWSPWRCSNAPADWQWGMEWGRVTYARQIGMHVTPGRELMITGTQGRGPTQTKSSYRVREVRLNMVTGPTTGKVHVYVGNTRMGTIDTRRPTWSMKNITIKSSRPLSGKVRLVAASGITATSHLYVIR
jgi:hypothetical protein